ncbi:carbohydrate ABC transporter permease [Pseudactinotalea sp. Z1748]|uniref:carbohydrate ABC transporter permease n=1 Tax=Pseudactinotalea sp. Z1748 TaxID=3413027 RepID=UPI003C7CAA55
MNRETTAGRRIKFAILGIWLIITIFPLYWILNTALKPAGEIASFPLTYWPRTPTLENFQRLLEQSGFFQNILNSVMVALSAATVATFIALLSGYVLARFTFRSKGAVMIAFLITQMIPAFIALGPLYLMMTSFGLTNSRFGLSLVYMAVCIPFSTIMLRGFFANVPDALEEAAMIDGCSRLQALFRVIVPVLTPGIIATFIFNFVNSWNELFLSVTLIHSSDKVTIPAALNGFISGFNVEWGPLAAAAVLTILPTMAMFALASRWIIQGLTAGAVKG